MPTKQDTLKGDKSKERKRLLMLATTCGPGQGSEEGVGWNRALQAAEHFETWVLCTDHHSSKRHEFLKSHGNTSGLRFIEIPWSGYLLWIGRIPGLYYLAYNLWHRQALTVARKLHAEIGFHLVHMVTFASFREPGYLWKLDIPFIWGPWGGTQNFPWKFLRYAGLKGALIESLRNLTNLWQLHFSSRVAAAAQRSAVILTANTKNQMDFYQAHGILPLIIMQNGINALIASKPSQQQPSDTLRILWAGRLEPLKGLPLLLHALARLPRSLPYQLRIMGGVNKSYQSLSRQLEIDANIEWLPWLDYCDVEQHYLWADIFVFTSMRETTPTVVLEAMGAGLPVIGLDHHGMADIITESCGILVPVNTPNQVIKDLGETIESLVYENEKVLQMQHAARQRAKKYLWSQNSEQMIQQYKKILVENSSPCKSNRAFL